MSEDRSFAKLLQKRFRSAAQGDEASSLIKSTRIDVRTLGYPDATDPTKVVWHAMSPAYGVDNAQDLWHVIEVQEEPNQYLSQIAQGERLVKVRMTDNKEAMPFQKAIERIAQWELSTMMKGRERAVQGHDRHDLGYHYFRHVAMRRGFIFDTIGNMVAAPDILPQESGKFLKSDLEMLHAYRDELKGPDKLDQLMNAQDPVYIRTMDEEDTSIQEDLESFGEIALFEKMSFFSEILVGYAKVQIQYIDEFYAHPERFADHFEGKKGLVQRLNENRQFFNQDLIDRINHTRKQFAETVFKFYHVAPNDWDHDLDFESPAMRKQLLINPDAQEIHDLMARQVSYPLDTQDVEQIVLIAARLLDFCGEMLQDSSQCETLRRKALYKNTDIKDILNFLDLLDVKYMYTELAEGATALPHTQHYSDIKAQNKAFQERVDNLIANLEESADWSPAQKQQIDDFIKAKSHVYLIDRVAKMPAQFKAAHEYIREKVLPRNQQLSFDFNVQQTSVEERLTKARATRGSQRQEEQKTEKPKGWLGRFGL